MTNLAKRLTGCTTSVLVLGWLACTGVACNSSSSEVGDPGSGGETTPGGSSGGSASGGTSSGGSYATGGSFTASGGSSSTGGASSGPRPTASGGSTSAGASSGAAGASTASGGSTASGTGGVSGATGGSPGTGGAGTGGKGPTQGGPQAGILTAGSWDDNLNFTWYSSYLARSDVQQIAGLPLIPRKDRLQIRVVDAAGAPVPGALVSVSGPHEVLLSAPTRGDGSLFFFPHVAPGVSPGALPASDGDALTIAVTLGNDTATAAAKVGDEAVTVHLAATQATRPTTLDLALVIDTTGSMADELAYLNVEVSNIAGQIAAAFPGVSQRWALVLYRDTNDAYVVRTYDFTDSLSAFQESIAAQKADGGGDYPESPEKALDAANKLSWRGAPGAGARVLFWIADAPHHADKAPAMVSAIETAQTQGIRMYPIAASGSDALVEYTMRTAAEVTGGRYLFLTNDSGVGVAQGHIEPTLAPCYFVTALNKAMVRMVSMELTGKSENPAPADLVRTVGAPDANGACQLASGTTVFVL